MKYFIPEGTQIHRYNTLLSMEQDDNYIHNIMVSTKSCTFTDDDIQINDNVPNYKFFKLPKKAEPWMLIGVYIDKIQNI